MTNYEKLYIRLHLAHTYTLITIVNEPILICSQLFLMIYGRDHHTKGKRNYFFGYLPQLLQNLRRPGKKRGSRFPRAPYNERWLLDFLDATGDKLWFDLSGPLADADARHLGAILGDVTSLDS